MLALEFWYARRGVDGLARVTAREEGRGHHLSIVIESDQAETTVLNECRTTTKPRVSRAGVDRLGELAGDV